MTSELKCVKKVYNLVVVLVCNAVKLISKIGCKKKMR